MKMVVVPFEPQHAAQIFLTSTDKVDLDEAYDRAEAYARSLIAMTGLNEDGDVVGCMGAIQVLPGVLHGWGIFNATLIVQVSPRQVYEEVCSRLPSLFNGEVRRLQADCVVGMPVFERFLTNMGFKKEGVLRKYGSGGLDHFLFSLVEEDIHAV